MKVSSSGIQNGRIALDYGKYGTHFIGDMPSYSLPISIKEAPAETRSFAFVLSDPDSIPVAGFEWIHWTVADLTRTALNAGEAETARDFVQGTNSWSSPLLPTPLSRLQAASYGGMAPPDKPHMYVLKVYALDILLNLKTGFYLNELIHAMEGHILETAVLTGVYEN